MEVAWIIMINNSDLAKRSSRSEQGDLGLLRPLGAFEELLYLMDQNRPLHAVLTAVVDGLTEVADWRRALNAVQKRHPLWSTNIVAAAGRPHFWLKGAIEVPLTVVEYTEDEQISREIALELAEPFDPVTGSLIRARLLFSPSRSALLLSGHHSICDGMSLAFALRDILLSMSGIELVKLGVMPALEDLVGLPTVQPLDAPTPEFLSYRAKRGFPNVVTVALSEEDTANLRDATRRNRVTVHSAIVAAAEIAASRCMPTWFARQRNITTTINVRSCAGLTDESLLAFSAWPYFPQKKEWSEDFWKLAHRVAESLSPGRTREGVEGVLKAVSTTVADHPAVAVGAARGGQLFHFDIHVSNLGRLPFESEFGHLTLEAIYGPAVFVGFEGEQCLGVSTAGGRMTMVHCSYEPIADFVDEVVAELKKASFQ